MTDNEQAHQREAHQRAGRRSERQRPPPKTAIGHIDALPARVLLDRLPVPVLAVQNTGRIVCANTAFAQMLGRTPSALVNHLAHPIITSVTDPASVLTHIQTRVGATIGLRHADGSTVHATVSESLLRLLDAPVVLVHLEKSSNPVNRVCQATSDAGVSGDGSGVISTGRSRSLPLWNSAPARTNATRCGAFTARQRAWAASISL